MASIMDAFSRAFENGQIKNKSTVVVESDEDSAEETRKNDEKKRAKKRKVNTGKKQSKAKRRTTKFTVRTAKPTVSVTPEGFPEIMSVESHFTGMSDSAELLVAETNFFAQQNNDNSHVRPFDFPYIRALIQRPPLPSFDIHKFNDRERLRVNVQRVNRAYEEQFLREPIGSERPCLQGSNCEGLHISSAKDRAFILREFLLPAEQAEYEATGKYSTERVTCVMCRRKELARAYFGIRGDNMSVELDSTLQDYCNIVNVKNEYRLEDCFVTHRRVYEGVLDPVVWHIRSAYRLKEINITDAAGKRHLVRHYEQWRMPYPSETSEKQENHFLFRAPNN